jgi:hypothetical protein
VPEERKAAIDMVLSPHKTIGFSNSLQIPSFNRMTMLTEIVVRQCSAERLLRQTKIFV